MLWEGNLAAAHPSLKPMEPRQISRHVVAMIQSWLFFGLLEAVVGKDIDVSNFVWKDTKGLEYLSTRNLHLILQSWIDQMSLVTKAEQSISNANALQALSRVADWVRRLNTLADPQQTYFNQTIENRYPGFSSLISSIIPATIRLGEAIDCARLTAFQELSSSLSWPYPDAVRISQEDLLRESGWCPFTLKMIEATLPWSCLDWLTTLPAGNITLNMKPAPLLTVHVTPYMWKCISLYTTYVLSAQI